MATMAASSIAAASSQISPATCKPGLSWCIERRRFQFDMVRGPSSSHQGAPEDTLTLDFINWLTICTSKGSISWEKQPALISTTLKGEMAVMYELSKTTPGALIWRLLIIRSPEGELLRHTRLL